MSKARLAMSRALRFAASFVDCLTLLEHPDHEAEVGASNEMRPTPSIDEVRDSLRAHGLPAEDEVAFVGEGWGCWAFRCGERILRFPKDGSERERMEQDCRLMAALAGRFSVRVPLPTFSATERTEDAFTSYTMLPGESLIRADVILPASGRWKAHSVELAPSFGRDLGRFLRELHTFPVERALEAGLTIRDGQALRTSRAALQNEALRTLEPLVTTGALPTSTLASTRI